MLSSCKDAHLINLYSALYCVPIVLHQSVFPDRLWAQVAVSELREWIKQQIKKKKLFKKKYS